VDPETLRKSFGWFVLIMSSVILAQEIHPGVGIATAAITLIAGVTAYACNRSEHCPLQRFGAHSRTSVATG
jgi:hypothetical protein